ncbi:MAG: DUF1631 family protein [Chromatiaceae bacterium]|nr:DUF1631 family protein [Chromatiaceae bacterium]
MAALTAANERRRHKRYQTRLAGRIESPDGQQRDCIVRDYCSGGMLLHQWQSGSARVDFKVGQQVKLHTELLDDAGARTIALPAVVAWVQDDYLGIAFARPSEAFVAVLQTHDRLAGSEIATATDPNPAGEARCLARLRHVARGELPGLLRELLVKTSEDLLESADQAKSNAEQQQLFGDMTALERLRSSDLLIKAILDTALDIQTVGTQPDQPTPGELALVDRDDFERWLEASRLGTLLERRFSSQLSALGSRLAALRGGASARPLAVPFEPQHFATSLKDVARRMEFGATTRRVLFDRAAKVFGTRLSELYDKFDAALDAVGVPAAQLPSQPVVARISATAASAPRVKGPADAHDGASATIAVSTPDDVASGTAAAPGVPAAVAAMRGAGGTGPVIAPAVLEAMMAREVQQCESLAREMVENVAEAPDMTESLAEWLHQLGEPMAREAASDRAFFQNREHPLRAIVDGLGHLQLFRATPDAAPADDPLRRRVTELLAPVRDGTADAQLLRSIADSIGDLANEQSRLYQRRVERVVEASEGRDQVRRARRAVVDELNRRYAGAQVPEMVPELLEVGWRAALELAWLKAYTGSGRLGEQLGVLDSLVAALGGEPYDREAPTIEPERLFEQIRRELDTVAFDPFRREALEDRLRLALLDRLSPQAQLIEMPVLDDGTAAPTGESPPDGIEAGVWQGYLERCAAVGVGDRLRMVDEPEGRQDLRVAWIREDRELFVLVDHRGIKAREMELRELASGLHRRRIRLHAADGRAMSERAVDGILQRMQDHLAYQAAHDSLTGLINRRQFHAALENALGVPGRPADAGVLLWIDVDQFRLVNDIHGYDTGDRLLIGLARLFERTSGAKVLGHMGGDRFAVLLPELAVGSGEQWAQELCAAVRAMPFDWQGQALGLSVSVGVVDLASESGTPAGVLQAAENALSVAKAAGGGQVYRYRAEDPDIARQKESVQWVVQVDEALDRGQLHLRCQPIVPVRPDQRLAPHYEVLLGVSSGASEPLPIAEFIEAAERYNRMRAVDRWVVKTVMEWVAAHAGLMPSLHGFAINLSGQTVSDPGIVDFVRQQFQRTGIDPSWLSFEITETAAIADLSRTAGIIRELKRMGCKLALDDFGSGLASYSYLKELPVDWLKIDGVFVRKIAADREDLAVVRSINDIGHFLGKQTIAEYVADEAILGLVGEIGVDFAQGYAISPPMLMNDLLNR